MAEKNAPRNTPTIDDLKDPLLAAVARRSCPLVLDAHNRPQLLERLPVTQASHRKRHCSKF